MNEGKLCDRIVSAIHKRAVGRGLNRVTRVKIEVGPFRDLDRAIMQLRFRHASRGTRLEGASLVIGERPLHGQCLSCEAEVTVRERYDPCPHCGSYAIEYSGGDEVVVTGMEGR
ncbi:MAG: hydrogenase maturation nickel metallochaperone HypA [Ectothiorhodospiraceae bacterium]|jgi:hydrogenase nickel incorporation protein HypA/HybF